MDTNNAFKIYNDISKVRYFRLGRHALLAGLKVLQLRPCDGVLVPAFICRDLLASIYAAGATPVFYEVNHDLNPVHLPKIDGVRAVLAVNYFGFPQDLSPFRKYCERNDTALIEDNAHGYLSSNETGTPLGSRGDIGIFSIRKTFSLPEGAILMVNNSKWQSRLSPQLPFRRVLLPPIFWIKSGLSWVQSKTHVPLLMAGKNLARHFRFFLNGYSIAPSPPENEFVMPNVPAPHNYSIKALSTFDATREIARRRKLYNEFHVLFATLNIQPVFKVLPKGTSPYGFPFYVEDQKMARRAFKLAKKRGFDCFFWPDLPASIISNAPLYYKTLLLVNFTI